MTDERLCLSAPSDLQAPDAFLLAFNITLARSHEKTVTNHRRKALNHEVDNRGDDTDDQDAKDVGEQQCSLLLCSIVLVAGTQQPVLFILLTAGRQTDRGWRERRRGLQIRRVLTLGHGHRRREGRVRRLLTGAAVDRQIHCGERRHGSRE